MSSLDRKLYPGGKELAHCRSLMEAARKATGVSKPFVFLDIKSRLFMGENMREKHNLGVAPGDSGDPGSQAAALGDELIRLRSDACERQVVVSATHLISFLFKNFLLGQVMGFRDNYGGAGGFLCYILALFSRAQSERVATISQADIYICSSILRV